MNYSIYNLKTGELERIVNVPDSMLSFQCDPTTHGIIEGTFPGDEYYILDGILKLIPERPSEFHYFDFLTKSWVLNYDLMVDSIRRQRDALLAQSDWTQLPDVPLDTKESWATYRKHLRDITSQIGFPTSVVWPVEPTL